MNERARGQGQKTVLKTATKKVLDWLLAKLGGLLGVLLAVTVVGVLGAVVIDQVLGGSRDKEMEALREAAEAAVERSRVVVDSAVDAILEVRVAHEDTAAALRGEVVTLKRQTVALGASVRDFQAQAGRLRVGLGDAATAADTIRIGRVIVAKQDSAIQACGLQVESCLEATQKLEDAAAQDSLAHGLTKDALGIMTTDRDTLRVLVVEFHEQTDGCKWGRLGPKWLGICSPSPTVTWLAGVGTGLVVGCVATDCLGGSEPGPTEPPPRDPKGDDYLR